MTPPPPLCKGGERVRQLAVRGTGNAFPTAPRLRTGVREPQTQSVEDGIPTQSVGTRWARGTSKGADDPQVYQMIVGPLCRYAAPREMPALTLPDPPGGLNRILLS